VGRRAGAEPGGLNDEHGAHRAPAPGTFEESDLAPFATLNVHPRAVETLGSTRTWAQSNAMVERYGADLEREGWGFWAVEVVGGAHFIGMVGLHRVQPTLPCTTASRRAASATSVAFTAAVNLPSQAVMERIGMVRQPHGDLDHPEVAGAARSGVTSPTGPHPVTSGHTSPVR
jgi:RimJ/RimL family protein N-acetyltransferase